MVAVNVGHEFGGPGLCRAGAALVGGKAEMPCERRLDAIAVEDFTFNRGAIDDFLRYEFDGQAIARIGVKVVQCADNEAGTFQKTVLRTRGCDPHRSGIQANREVANSNA